MATHTNSSGMDALSESERDHVVGAYKRGFDDGYQVGLQEGRAAQAIIELRARDRFLASQESQKGADR